VKSGTKEPKRSFECCCVEGPEDLGFLGQPAPWSAADSPHPHPSPSSPQESNHPGALVHSGFLLTFFTMQTQEIRNR
jgi:hypothetical protein